MELEQAAANVLLGEAMYAVAAAYREHLIASFGLDPDDVRPGLFQKETRVFMNKLCRQLGDRHGGDYRALVALRDWVRETEDYEAFDALLSGFDFEGKDVLIQRGRMLFAGPMTAHWDG